MEFFKVSPLRYCDIVLFWVKRSLFKSLAYVLLVKRRNIGQTVRVLDMYSQVRTKVRTDFYGR